MRKSTVIDGIAKTLVKNAWRSFYQRTSPRLTPQQIDEIISKRFIETGSYEGIVKHISELQNEFEEFFIISTEWGGVLQLMKNREYMTGFATLLSKLWSGEEHLPRLVHETRYIRGGLYVTALLGMQEPWLYIDNWLFRQGLMRRVLLIYQEPEDKTRWLPPLDMGRIVHYDELRDIGEEIAELMISYEEANPVEARFSSEAFNMINQYAQQVEAELRQQGGTGNWTLYYQNMWDHLVKLSVIHSISRYTEPAQTQSGFVIYVESIDVKAALSLINRHLEKAKKAITLSGVPVKTAEITVSEPAEETVKSIIEATGDRGIDSKNLLRATKMKKKEVKEIVVNLVEKGDVNAYMINKRIVFVAAKFATRYESRIPAATKLSPKQLELLW